MNLNEKITERLLGEHYVKLTVYGDDRLFIDYKGYCEFIDDPMVTKFPFHTRLRELACLSPGSVYEFRYKFYPPSVYCSLNGLSDLLNFIVPPCERLHEMFQSSGVFMYLTNSPMEKFKIFYDDNFTHEYFPDKDVASAEIRDAVSRALFDALDILAKYVSMDKARVLAARRTYFGAFIDHYNPREESDSHLTAKTMPGLAVVGRCRDKLQLRKDLVHFFLKNYEVTQQWMSQFN